MNNRRDFFKQFSLALLGGGAALYLPRNARATSTIQTVNSLNNITMLNSTWGRPVSLPSSWSKIRFGLLLHFANAGAALASTPVFAMGFCSGTAALEGDQNPTHFVGLKTTSTNWVDEGCGSFNVLGSIALQPAVNVAGTETLGTAITSDLRMSMSATSRFLFFLDVTKGSPNYTLNAFCVNGAGGSCGTDASVSTFLTQVALNSASYTSHSFGSSQTMAVNEALNGTLNAVNVYWSRADVACNVCALAVAVLA